MMKEWDDLSGYEKACKRLSWFVQDRFTHPVRSRDGAWSWHMLPSRVTPWLLVPKTVQRWWVHSRNVRHCAVYGHDDLLYHLGEDGIIPTSEASCTNCLAPVHECTGKGAGYIHERKPVEESR